MDTKRLTEFVFLLAVLLATGYLAWKIFAPFATALILAAIIATACYPLYHRILRLFAGRLPGLAAFLSTLAVFLVVFVPIGILGYLLFREAVGFYVAVAGGKTVTVAPMLIYIEELINQYFPTVSFDLTTYAQRGAQWIATSLGSIFAGAAATALTLTIAFIGLFYFLRDGERLVQMLIRLSPLPNNEDEHVVRRLTRAVRSVLLGTIFIGVMQGISMSIGLTIFGVPQAILLGSLTVLTALIPAIGASFVFVPIAIYLFITGSIVPAIGVLLWGTFFVALIDNILAPQLIGKRATLHPFVVLLSAIGGLALFGPVGFILGPVVMSFFMVLLELFEAHMNAGRKHT